MRVEDRSYAVSTVTSLLLVADLSPASGYFEFGEQFAVSVLLALLGQLSSPFIHYVPFYSMTISVRIFSAITEDPRTL